MNKQLSKEECLEALEKIDFPRDIEDLEVGFATIERLIDEHFDNPPLKFEEIEPGMWIWVKDMCKYKQVKRKYVMELDEIEMVYVDGYHLGFEENRFYRHEVK